MVLLKRAVTNQYVVLYFDWNAFMEPLRSQISQAGRSNSEQPAFFFAIQIEVFTLKSIDKGCRRIR
jgi:hypothetical protein